MILGVLNAVLISPNTLVHQYDAQYTIAYFS